MFTGAVSDSNLAQTWWRSSNCWKSRENVEEKWFERCCSDSPVKTKQKPCIYFRPNFKSTTALLQSTFTCVLWYFLKPGSVMCNLWSATEKPGILFGKTLWNTRFFLCTSFSGLISFCDLHVFSFLWIFFLFYFMSTYAYNI